MIYLLAIIVGFLSLLVFFGICIAAVSIMDWLTRLFPVLEKSVNNWGVVICLLIISLTIGLTILNGLGWWKP
mgnify:CR=1